MSTSLLALVCEAQTENSTLSQSDLRAAAHNLAALVVDRGHAVMAVDEAGERLIGAALVLDERLQAVNVSRRLDDQAVILVAGYIAGTTGVARKAALVRSLGARHVEATLLGEEALTIEGCERVTPLALTRRLVAL